MTTNSIFRGATAVALTASLLLPSLALAQTAGGAASTTISAAVMTRAKEKANREVVRRVSALNDLTARINAMTKVTPELKQNIITNINTQVAALNTLNAKIQAGTDGATLRADIQSITQAYRVYALLMPQARITAAADREATLVNMLAELGAKLQTRLQEAATAGADVTALAAALTEMGTKLGSAQTHAQTAITTSATLTPDGGDQAKMKSNNDALKAARAEIAAAHQDLKDARKSAQTIINGLKALGTGTSTQTP